MRQCTDCSAIDKAMNATREALEYSQRRGANDGLVSYNHDEAIRLARVAAQLSDTAPVNHYHSVWYVSEEDDFAMMEVDPDAFHQIKEHMSDRAAQESILKPAPLDLWADHIEWSK